MMATPANHGRDSTQPTCQNCQTSTTPLWRRDEYGAVLCNACGLFLKLHGRPRPISLKTDVIKSRNRVKTMRPDLANKKKQAQQQQQAQHQSHAFSGGDPNGFDLHAQPGTVASGQRPVQKSANGQQDGGNSPGSRADTPSLYNPGMPVFQGLDDPQFQSFAMSSNSPNRPASPLNGNRHLDPPQTHEQLIATNSALKTRVSELEFINELFRGRLGQLEHDEANARRGQEINGQTEAQLRAELEESHRRENNLKRRLDELELELQNVKDALEATEPGRATKKPRLTEPEESNNDNPPEEAPAAASAVASAVAETVEAPAPQPEAASA
ncbi:hypothetical protein SODALDRAFT_339987 [Sodiomyces alkalinus F11]|uniref:GATA-type domain-containing protein n=1 Tax=Sodiomyces alkalinus (strain CBS 110278 / VKM F-3762 / F11) TaxID=1314773 RepID=A0A3N2PVZ0_SODAK|nr:hypothetical protein SODALDRAFT_339987 [Sodiomyces alkalinus F11]ROT38669.1 hypothetical protein SODALDRAFT_339987 [Sodiomyces alkalinus F11]